MNLRKAFTVWYVEQGYGWSPEGDGVFECPAWVKPFLFLFSPSIFSYEFGGILMDGLKDGLKDGFKSDEFCTDCKEYDHEKHCCPRFNHVIRKTLQENAEAAPRVIRCKDCALAACYAGGRTFCYHFHSNVSLDSYCSYAIEKGANQDILQCLYGEEEKGTGEA